MAMEVVTVADKDLILKGKLSVEGSIWFVGVHGFEPLVSLFRLCWTCYSDAMALF